MEYDYNMTARIRGQSDRFAERIRIVNTIRSIDRRAPHMIDRDRDMRERCMRRLRRFDWLGRLDDPDMERLRLIEHSRKLAELPNLAAALIREGELDVISALYRAKMTEEDAGSLVGALLNMCIESNEEINARRRTLIIRGIIIPRDGPIPGRTAEEDDLIRISTPICRLTGFTVLLNALGIDSPLSPAPSAWSQ